MLPALMAPQPKGRLTANVRFEQAHISFRQLVVGDGVHIVRHLLKPTAITPTAFALHISKEYSRVDALRDALCSEEIGQR